MEMDEGFLEINDLDWFASYKNGMLAHFATSGRGYVPVSVRRSIADYEMLYGFFESLSENVGFEIIEENLPRFNDSYQRELYLRSFIAMARKGLLSHDADEDGSYKLIVRPVVNVEYLSLPDNIKYVICVLSNLEPEKNRSVFLTEKGFM